MEESLGSLDRRVAVLEANTGSMKESIGRIEVDLRDMRKSVDQRFEALDRKLDSFHQELRGVMRFLVGVVISFFTTLIAFGAAILGVLVKGFHWLN